LHALLFDTSRRPFVVKNPVYGNVNGGPVAFEVPWREGTETAIGAERGSDSDSSPA
jgi:hypothetical protein